MKEAKLIRHTDTGKETLGDLLVFENGIQIFRCCTLERPWNNNQHGISCIPEMVYPEVVFSHMVTVNKDHYQIMNVPNRDAIFIHGGVTFLDTHGCIILCYEYADFNKDGEKDASNSGNAIRTFENIMKKETFKLEIVQAYSLS